MKTELLSLPGKHVCRKKRYNEETRGVAGNPALMSDPIRVDRWVISGGSAEKVIWLKTNGLGSAVFLQNCSYSSRNDSWKHEILSRIDVTRRGNGYLVDILLRIVPFLVLEATNFFQTPIEMNLSLVDPLNVSRTHPTNEWTLQLEFLRSHLTRRNSILESLVLFVVVDDW